MWVAAMLLILQTEMANIHARVLAWGYVLRSLGYTLKSQGSDI